MEPTSVFHVFLNPEISVVDLADLHTGFPENPKAAQREYALRIFPGNLKVCRRQTHLIPLECLPLQFFLVKIRMFYKGKTWDKLFLLDSGEILSYLLLLCVFISNADCCNSAFYLLPFPFFLQSPFLKTSPLWYSYDHPALSRPPPCQTIILIMLKCVKRPGMSFHPRTLRVL